ncbi:MAG: radical SAM protein, partial [Candidatus Omnitrophica bacterium]|nr:radical SAM protein [Candidatus Omnitrophota bacterium]
MAKGILISYAGYPYTPSSLLPDNGLANLAGALIQNGHEVLVLDYGTVDVVKRLVPTDIGIALKDIYNKAKKIKEKKGSSALQKMFLFHTLRHIDRALTKHQNNQTLMMAEELLDLIKEQKPDFVGFKLWVGDGFAASVKMAEIIKRKFPHIKLFGGGPLLDEAEEVTMEVAPVFDAVSFAEGEETIVDLALYCEGKKALSEISNLIYKTDKKRIVKTGKKIIDDLDSLSLPVYDEAIYPAMKDGQKIKIILLDESRGCPYRCFFCPHEHKSGGKRRTKSPQRIFQEIKRLVESYGIHAFRYAGSCTPFETLNEVANNILSDNLDVLYTSYANAKLADLNNLDLLKRSGLHALFFGIETGDDRILHEMMNKRMVSVELIKNKVQGAIEKGIFCVGSVIFPAPGETPQTRDKLLGVLKEIYTHEESGSV